MEFDTVVALVGVIVAANLPTYYLLVSTMQRVDNIAKNCKHCNGKVVLNA